MLKGRQILEGSKGPYLHWFSIPKCQVELSSFFKKVLGKIIIYFLTLVVIWGYKGRLLSAHKCLESLRVLKWVFSMIKWHYMHWHWFLIFLNMGKVLGYDFGAFECDWGVRLIWDFSYIIFVRYITWKQSLSGKLLLHLEKCTKVKWVLNLRQLRGNSLET